MLNWKTRELIHVSTFGWATLYSCPVLGRKRHMKELAHLDFFQQVQPSERQQVLRATLPVCGPWDKTSVPSCHYSLIVLSVPKLQAAWMWPRLSQPSTGATISTQETTVFSNTGRQQQKLTKDIKGTCIETNHWPFEAGDPDLDLDLDLDPDLDLAGDADPCREPCDRKWKITLWKKRNRATNSTWQYLLTQSHFYFQITSLIINHFIFKAKKAKFCF